jgi:uncharacterized damage-inducible protein DinB
MTTRKHISKNFDSIDILLALIDQSYNKKAWHGTNLRGSIRGLTAKEASQRPSPSRHNIWEIVIHCAYWKYIVRRRILGEKKGSFPLKGSNWFRRPSDLSEEEWRGDIELLESSHASVREAVTDLTSRDLSFIPRGSKVDNLAIIMGIASHDLYHAGQIQLLKRLLR